MSRQNISLSKIVIFTLLAATTIVLTAFGIFNYFHERNARLKELRAELRVVSGQLSSSLALPMWNFDYEQINKIIESTMQNRQVFGVVVKEAARERTVSARIRDERGGIVPAKGEIEADGLLIDRAEIAFNNQHLGTVRVFITPRFMEESLRSFLLNIAAGTLILNICLVSLLFRLLSRTVIKPLKSIEDYARKVGAGKGDDARIQDDGYFGELDSLKRSMAEMTRSLLDAQEELVRNEKLAVLGQLSGSVGHELRNPLGVMSNAVYFLQTVLADADESTREYLEIIKHEIDNSERIITDLLDFARTRTPQTSAIAAGELIAASVGRCVLPDTIRLCTEVSAGLPKLSVDPLQMGQVLQNLITNAVQAMMAGGSLHLTARQIMNDELRSMSSDSKFIIHNSKFDGDFIAIAVTDNGEGITPENMAKLFQPLFTTKARGIGLGLVVCKNLVAANDGQIEVESAPGQGTTFTVLLPIERGQI
jgi:signal transduction histidine kinase